MFQTALVYFSLVITAVGTIPYIIDILKRKTKPRIVSWGVWCVITAIAAFASFSDHQYPAGFLMLAATIQTIFVVVLGYRNGDKTFETLDIVCLVGAALGLLAWWLSGSPALAVIITVAIDFIGAIPSIVHSWKRPYEETWVAFFCSGLGGIATVLAAQDWTITSVLYPLYIVVANIVFVAVIIGRKDRVPVRTRKT
jgi:hypothetical protein